MMPDLQSISEWLPPQQNSMFNLGSTNTSFASALPDCIGLRRRAELLFRLRTRSLERQTLLIAISILKKKFCILIVLFLILRFNVKINQEIITQRQKMTHFSILKQLWLAKYFRVTDAIQNQVQMQKSTFIILNVVIISITFIIHHAEAIY
ncbi:unnamed protein product [Paramecium octaurelia]|uniref:Transmembrane protein n=1 Tax=Paramecium octaurelia TaxID=43137 RepID=A0A8S1XI19_PAROT|nr:unnamed protein product [Paramecium octaurelia]